MNDKLSSEIKLNLIYGKRHLKSYNLHLRPSNPFDEQILGIFILIEIIYHAQYDYL